VGLCGLQEREELERVQRKSARVRFGVSVERLGDLGCFSLMKWKLRQL